MIYALTLLLCCQLPGPDANEVAWSKYLAAYELSLPDDSEGYHLPDGTFADIYDPSRGVVWEVEWCNKTDESFGQAARYATQTGLEPGIWILWKPGMKGWEEFKDALSFYERSGVTIHVRLTDVRTGTTRIIRR